MVRRMSLLVGVVVLALAAWAVPSGAGEQNPQMSVTPNPVEEGADITIANVSGATHTCESSDLQSGAEGGGNEVDVNISDDGGVIFSGSATTDADGNWQLVTQIGEAGEYIVAAACNGPAPSSASEAFGPFEYDPVDLTVVAGEPAPPVPPVPPAPAADAVTAAPAFTG